MARVVILGAGIAGHTAAMVLRRTLPKEHVVCVVSPKPDYNWIPSNIWVGVGRMAREKVVVPLAPIYARLGIEFIQASATEIHPAGNPNHPGPYIVATPTTPGAATESVEVAYDWLINATGPKLRFDRTPGLGPDGGHTHSVCTDRHAVDAATALDAAIQRMKAGERQTLVVGMGHGTCTCEGAAFEYTFNVEHELRRHGVRDLADLVYLTNEAELGDFGVDGLVIRNGGFHTPSSVFAGSFFAERSVQAILGAHVQAIEPGLIRYETLDGVDHEQRYDFAMLLPPFTGVGLKAFGAQGEDITDTLFAPSGFTKVDADYTPKPYEAWKPTDWPSTYRNPTWKNVFAVGIAFAPPHPISRPRTSPRGTVISPAPPRTGMPSASMARAVAENIADMILGRATEPERLSSMANMGAACVASAGSGFWAGNAVAMTMFPIVPDYTRWPGAGRDERFTFGEVGTAGHWIKLVLHHLFLYKARAKPFWWMVPE